MQWRTIGAAAVLALCTGALTGHAQTKASGEDLTLYPGAITMAERDERVIAVATRSGKAPLRVEWTVSNSEILAIAPHGPTAAIKGKSAGRVLVTARVNGRAVNATITVAEEPDLRFGATRWSIAPVAGLVPRPLLEASRVDEDGADIFAVDADPAKRFAVVRALRANGTLVWQSTVRGTPWAGDRFGGLLARLGPPDQPSRNLARFDRPRSAVPAWRYKARGDIDDFAEADDGTIFLVEQNRPRMLVARGESSQVSVIDGKTGLETGHFVLPPSTWQTSGSCGTKGSTVRRPSELGPLGEGANGGVYAEMLLVHDSWTRVCEKGRPVLGRGRFKVSRELQLVRLTRKGVTPVRALWRIDVEGPDSPDRLRAIEDVAPGPVAELKSGELVSFRTQVSLDAAGRLSGRLHVVRVVRGDLGREVVRPGNSTRANKPWRVLVDAPADGPWVYFADGSTMQAIDLGAGATVWTIDTAALPFQALEGRSVAASDSVRGQMIELSQRGVLLRTFPARVDDARIVASGQAIVHGVDPQTRALIEVQEPAYVESSWSTMLDVETDFAEVRRRFADFLIETR